MANVSDWQEGPAYGEREPTADDMAVAATWVVANAEHASAHGGDDILGHTEMNQLRALWTLWAKQFKGV